MPRIIFYELKKIFSLPVVELWAVVMVILVATTVGRYTGFVATAGMGVAQVRELSMKYAGPLNQELADRALRDWRTLPEVWSDRDLPGIHALRQVLTTLNEEFNAASASISAQEPPKGASADAAVRLMPLLQTGSAPFVHGYWEGWRALLAAWDGEAGWLCALLVAFGTSALFSGEGAATMVACVRTTRHGRGAVALGKLSAAAAYAALCALICIGLPLVLCAVFFGLQGGGLPAQFAMTGENTLAYPLTLAQYEGLRAVLAVLGALALAGCTALFSAAMPSVTTPAVATLALFAAPMVLGQIKLTSPMLDSILRYLPSRLLLAQPILKELQVSQLWREALWQPEWLCVLWAAALPCLGALAAWQWLQVRREEPITQD
jgi:hypothetical protein